MALFVSWLVLNRPSNCHEGAKYTVALAGLAFTYLTNFILGTWLIHEGLKGSSNSSSNCGKNYPMVGQVSHRV